jgi:hypothetical protein
MSTDKVKSKETANIDTTWSILAKLAEDELERLKEQQKTIRKSLKFFKEQDESGSPFPIKNTPRH